MFFLTGLRRPWTCPDCSSRSISFLQDATAFSRALVSSCCDLCSCINCSIADFCFVGIDVENSRSSWAVARNVRFVSTVFDFHTSMLVRWKSLVQRLHFYYEMSNLSASLFIMTSSWCPMLSKTVRRVSSRLRRSSSNWPNHLYSRQARQINSHRIWSLG